MGVPLRAAAGRLFRGGKSDTPAGRRQSNVDAADEFARCENAAGVPQFPERERTAKITLLGGPSKLRKRTDLMELAESIALKRAKEGTTNDAIEVLYRSM